MFGIGAPNGGNGGPGGNVYLLTDDSHQHFSFDKFHYKAGKGGNGGSDNLHGGAGSDCTIEIPPGTAVREILGKDTETGKWNTRVIADLDKPGMKLRVADGAIGGLGNRTFRSSDRIKAQIATPGKSVEPIRLELELKLIADVGLVGYPNAGKSSFLSAISRAAPKIANYPFTTLHPSIGTAILNDAEETSFTVADLPGLVDGAHMNVGLGHEFLRHIERTKVLLYVIDIARPLKHMTLIGDWHKEQAQEDSTRRAEYLYRQQQEEKKVKLAEYNRKVRMKEYFEAHNVPRSEWKNFVFEQMFPKDHDEDEYTVERLYDKPYDEARPRGRRVTDLGDPVAEFLSLRKELALYQPELALRPSIVFLNKADVRPVACAKQIERIREAIPAHWPVFAGSARAGTGLDNLLLTLKNALVEIENQEENRLDQDYNASLQSNSEEIIQTVDKPQKTYEY